jgi:hypothetical protein
MEVYKFILVKSGDGMKLGHRGRPLLLVEQRWLVFVLFDMLQAHAHYPDF